MGTLSLDEIRQLGFGAVGTDVVISDRCSIYGAASIRIGDHVRIDDFAILTAREPLIIGSFVHISAFVFLSGSFGIAIDDFVNVSPRATLLSGNDDFSGQWLPGSQIPDELRNVQAAPIHLGRYSMVGAHSVVLPGVSFGEGTVVGALSLVKESLAPWGIYGGVPARLIRPRARGPEALAAHLR
jgi:acetyltransferase-like isoleucine patch superfamily enzyme